LPNSLPPASQSKPSRRIVVRFTLTRCLEIISEAARRLPQSLRNRHPELPWRAIMGAGNVYRHDYDSVAEEIVWQTVQQNLAPLLKAVERELSREGGSN
jgi:uncharacterized protein with HEPN domain